MNAKRVRKGLVLSFNQKVAIANEFGLKIHEWVDEYGDYWYYYEIVDVDLIYNASAEEEYYDSEEEAFEAAIELLKRSPYIEDGRLSNILSSYAFKHQVA